MSWVEITNKKIPEQEKPIIKPKVAKNKEIIELTSDEDTPEEIFYLQKGSEFFDFISDLQYELERGLNNGVLNGVKRHKIYDFFDNYIDYYSSINKKYLMKNEQSDSEEYDD